MKLPGEHQGVLRSILIFSCLFSVLVGIVVILTWWFDATLIRRVSSGVATMKMNTAVGFLLSGISLWLLRADRDNVDQRRRRVFGKFFGFVVALIGLLTLSQYLFNVNLRIDQIFTPERLADEPSRMASATAVILLLIGLSLLLLDVKIGSRHFPAQWLAILAGNLSLLVIIGYVYGTPSLYSVSAFASVALHTAITGLVLSVGILIARPNTGWVSVIFKNSTGGVLARRLLPPALVIPFVVGILRLRLEDAGYITTEFGVALVSATTIGAFTLLIWWAARSQDQTDVQRQSAEEHRQRSDNHLAGVISSAMDAIISVDSSQRIVLFNAAAERMFLRSASEVLGQRLELLIPERFRPSHSTHVEHFGRTNISKRSMGELGSIFGLRSNGEEFPIEASISQIEMENEKLFTVIMRDITGRMRAEERFRIALEAAPNAMIMIDAEGKIVFTNSLIEKIFGYTREELLGKVVETLVPMRFRHSHPTFRSDFFGSPQARLMGAGRDLFGLHKDGREIPVEIGLNPMTTEEGVFVLASIIDITERKLAEQNLRRSQEQLAGVIGSAMDAIVTVNEEQRVVLFNSAAERMFRFPAEEALGQDLNRFIPARFRDAHASHIENFGRTNVTKRSMGALGAIFGLRSDGEEFPIEASISQLESGGEKFYTVILRDITERKSSEAALREQANILDLAPVLIRDLNGRIIFWNSGAEKMYGWTKEQAIGKHTQTLLQTIFPQPLEDLKAKLFAVGHWEGELTHTTQEGKRIVVASHWVLHKNENEEPRAILEINNDITERKRAEEEVRRLNEELEERVLERTAQLQAANKELEAFSYSVSHDLRAPLRHINGFSQALLEDYSDKLDETGRLYLKEVRGASQEMAQLIDDVLQLARLTRSEMRSEVVNLTQVAEDVANELSKREPDRTVSLLIEPDLDARCDKRLLRIVLTNLLGNAWKFTSHELRPEIVVGKEIWEEGEHAFFVRDNGAGFDMAFSDKLFGAFQRLHSASEFEGTGIGLAIVQRIVNRHGGRVWAKGEVNNGATFYFTLPTRKEIRDEV